MLLVAILVVWVLLTPLFGGRLHKLAELELRGRSLVFGALGIAVAISVIWPYGQHRLHLFLNFSTYACAAVALYLNRRIPGVKLIAVGTASNIVAMALNGGIMPAAPRALHSAGLVVGGKAFLSSTVVAHPHLAWLGDVFAVPAAVPGANVFSIGDVTLLIGACTAMWSITGSRFGLRRPGRTGRAGVQANSTESSR